MSTKKRLLLLAANALIAGPILAYGADSEKLSEESANAMQANIVATSIRDKGHPCSAVRSMQRIERGDADIRTAWQVQCDDGHSYRVVYLGDRGFKVDPGE